MYREAARRVELGEDEFACVALKKTGCEDEVAVMAKLFKPEHSMIHWFGSYNDFEEGSSGLEARNARVVMLCFMAAMVEAGDA